MNNQIVFNKDTITITLADTITFTFKDYVLSDIFVPSRNQSILAAVKAKQAASGSKTKVTYIKIGKDFEMEIENTNDMLAYTLFEGDKPKLVKVLKNFIYINNGDDNEVIYIEEPKRILSWKIDPSYKLLFTEHFVICHEEKVIMPYYVFIASITAVTEKFNITNKYKS